MKAKLPGRNLLMGPSMVLVLMTVVSVLGLGGPVLRWLSAATAGIALLAINFIYIRMHASMAESLARLHLQIAGFIHKNSPQDEPPQENEAAPK